jgi:DNA-binding SARP family transcriptional activator
MKKANEQYSPSYPLIRVITFGEFAIERLVTTPLDPGETPCYMRILPEEWDNRSSAMLLLKVLLCREQRRAAREDLISTIWPDRAVINTEHAFDSAASILRRRVLRISSGESLLLTIHTSRGISFKLAAQPHLWIDADALLAFSAQSLRVTSRGQNPLALLEKAHALAHGEFLEDDLTYTWTQRRRHTLNGVRRRILYKLVELYLKEKRVWQAEELLYAFLEENPTDEDALCRLMILLVEQGRRQEALQLYRYTVDILREEQRGPAPYTKDLATRIRSGTALKEQTTNYVATRTTIATSPGWGRYLKTRALRKLRVLALQIQMMVMNVSLYSNVGRWSTMRIEVDKMYYDNYLFRVELDTGAETGTNQLTVWCAEKMNTATMPLAQFKPQQLLRALLEPHKSSLHARLEQEKCNHRRLFENEMLNLQNSALAPSHGKTESAKIKYRINDLHKQMNIALQRLEIDFMHRVLLELDRSCFDAQILQQECCLFGNERFLRDFYFEESSKQHIRTFCRKFATNEAYRQQITAREVSWVKRNALFLRNLYTLFGEQLHSTNSYEYENKARDFFHWISRHYASILALPEYARLQQIDNAFTPDPNEPDPYIRPAVALFNLIPGVTTRYSCQGVSGKVQFQGRNLLVVSEHEEYAYISFSKLEEPAKKALLEVVPQFPGITDTPLPGNFALWSVLRSTGDNIRFRAEIIEMAQLILETMGHKEGMLSDVALIHPPE